MNFYPAARTVLAGLFTRWVMTLMLLVASTSVLSQTAERTAFDHVKTGFALSGVHTSARCESCHVKGIFKGTPKDCSSCHVSGARLAQTNTVMPQRHLPTTAACETCHTTQSFLGAKFNHAGVAAGSCASCHNGVTAPGKTQNHVATQASCDSCHRTTAWRPAAKFDHTGVSPGSCATCHNGTKATGKTANHVATSQACDSCHNTSRWTGAKVDHNSFNAATNCASCHNGSQASGKSGRHVATSENCASCHSTTAGGRVQKSITAPSPQLDQLRQLPQRHPGNGQVRHPCAHHSQLRYLPQHDGNWTGAKVDHSTLHGRDQLCDLPQRYPGQRQARDPRGRPLPTA